MDLTKALDFLEKQGLADCHYQDSGMMEHIAENMQKYADQQLILSGVMQPLPSKEEMTLELNTMLKELNKDVKPSYLKRSVLKGVEIGFKTCYQYVTGNFA